MRERILFNFYCETYFSGEISRIENEVCIEFTRVISKMQSQKVYEAALL